LENDRSTLSRPGTRLYRGASGLSSIALAVADAGQPGKHTEQQTGQVLVSQTTLTWWNIVPTILIIASLIPLYWWMMPAPEKCAR